METSSLQRLHILVVEDNLINQKVFKMQLTSLGFLCDVVDTGIKALNALEQKEYSLVLLDCQIPKMDGLEFVREVRGRVSQPWSRIVIIAVTADLINFSRERCLGGGMNDWLSKPFRMEQLSEIIGQWLG
jgi:CheY-like chemotaxis protein